MRARGEGATTTKVSPADAAMQATAAMEATAAVKPTAGTTLACVATDRTIAQASTQAVNFDLSLNMDVVMAPLPRNGAAKQGKRHAAGILRPPFVAASTISLV
jgi:3-keto-L-gulonate-6-phosphate decarboxylase